MRQKNKIILSVAYILSDALYLKKMLLKTLLKEYTKVVVIEIEFIKYKQ